MGDAQNAQQAVIPAPAVYVRCPAELNYQDVIDYSTASGKLFFDNCSKSYHPVKHQHFELTKSDLRSLIQVMLVATATR